MYCMHCGKQLPQGAAFCPSCVMAATVQNEESAVSPITEETFSPPQEDAPQDCNTFAVLESVQRGVKPDAEPTRNAADSFEQPAQAASSWTPPAHTQQKRSFPRWLLFAFCGIVILVIVLIIVFLLNGKQCSTNVNAASAASVFASSSLNGLPAVNDADFSWPKPGTGEKLYIGTAQYQEIQRFYVAFVLSSDGSTIHDVVIRAENMTLQMKQGNTSTKISNVTITENSRGSYAVSPNKTDIELGKSKLTGLIINSGEASGVIDYVYTHRGFNLSSPDTAISLGKSQITLKNYTNALNAAAPITSPSAAERAYGSVSELFIFVNTFTNEAEFSSAYEKGMKFIAQSGLEDEWKNLCEGASAYLDFLANSALYETVSSYAFEDFAPEDYPHLNEIKPTLENGNLNDHLRKLIYTPNNSLNLPAALWMKSSLHSYLGAPAEGALLNPDDAKMQTLFFELFGENLKAFYEEFNASNVKGTFEDFVCEQLKISKAQLKEALADEDSVTDERQLTLLPDNPQPLTAILIDASEKIGVDNSSEGFYPVSDAKASNLVSRAREVYDAICSVSGGQIIFTGNPELADIIITMNVKYPFKGTYTAGTAKASVYGCTVTVDAYRVGLPDKTVTFTASHIPGNTVNGRGSIIWMSFPQLEDNTDVQSFVEDVTAWYK